MNRSLIQWISLTCHDYLHITSQTLLDHSSSENEFIANLIIVLGQHLLPNEHIKTPNDMLHIFTKFFRINGEYDQINEENQMVLMLKLLLKFVVSPHCGERESFVAYILSLTPEIQEDLMEALQSGDLEDINVEEEQEEIAEAEDSPLKKEKSSFPSSTWSHENESYCDLCPQLKQELEKCHKEISSFVQRERLQQESHRTENSLQMHKIMDLESLVTEKTSLLNQITSEFNQLKKKELEIAQEVKEKSAMAMKISELQDQVDSLIQMSKRADVAEKQVEKLREKLDRLDGVSEQLKAETTAHNETHVTLLQYEQELNTLRTAKQHLEEYRKRCVENEIQINDLKIQLKKSEGSNESLLSQLKELMDGNELSSNHAKILTKELLNASEEIRNHERGLGVGLGISEFNPEVKKELQTLRAENEELKQQINDSSLQSLDLLRQQISDQQCFNSSLQEKWNDAKHQIKQLQKSLAGTTQQLDHSRHSLHLLTLESKELSRCAEEDRLSLAHSFHCKEKFLRQSSQDQWLLLSLGKQNLQKNLENEVIHLYTDLEKKTVDYEEMKESYVSSQEVVQSQQETIERWTQEYSSLKSQTKEEMNLLREETEKEVKRCDEKFQLQLTSLTQDHSHELSLEKRRFESLEDEMEAERSKRRKVERERKYYENEALKYRNQYELFSSGNMNSSELNAKEMTSVIKEMKTMQEQLDHSREEVKRLQDQLSFIQSTGAGAAGGAMTSLELPGVVDEQRESEADLVAMSSQQQQQQQGIHSGPTRQAQRIRLQSTTATSSSSSSASSSTLSSSSTAVSFRSNTTDLSAYIEQTELLERKIEQMNRERRELIAKNIEENKEKVELNQRLLQQEREFTTMKSKFVKLELEKERLERRIAKGGGSENVAPAVSSRRRALESL